MMNNPIAIRLFACFVLLISGCYEEEIDTLQRQIERQQRKTKLTETRQEVNYSLTDHHTIVFWSIRYPTICLVHNRYENVNLIASSQLLEYRPLDLFI